MWTCAYFKSKSRNCVFVVSKENIFRINVLRRKGAADASTIIMIYCTNIHQLQSMQISRRQQIYVNEATYTDSCIVLFQIMSGNLYNNGVVVSTYVFVDDGANVIVIDKQIAEKLNVKGLSTTLDLQWMNSAVASESSEVVELMISGVKNGYPKYKMANVFTSSNLSLPTQTFIVRDSSEKYSHLAELPLASNVKPKLIIGFRIRI